MTLFFFLQLLLNRDFGLIIIWRTVLDIGNLDFEN